MIKFVVFDFDGVFTDGKCYFDNERILKYYDIKDGKGLSLLRNNDILTGCISAYSTEKQVELNNNNIDNEILSHLKFEYVSIGSSNKLDILNKWLNELDIDINDVAYIGDDLTDIQILDKVGFSACPNDAVQECKDVVNYVCDKRGGYGCVREFVEVILKMNGNDKFDSILCEIKRKTCDQLNEYANIRDDIHNLIDIINSSGSVYFTGVGKSKTMSTLCCNLLKSVGINAQYLDAMDGTHGDIGCIDADDVVIMFSNSGNTFELVQLIHCLKTINCTIVGVCGNDNSKFHELCDVTLRLPFDSELVGNSKITKIPSMSLQSQLVFCNMLVCMLKSSLTTEEYKTYHPGGNIGNTLKTLRDFIIYDYPLFDVNKKSYKLRDLFISMTEKKVGCVFFTNKRKLVGILTDGDIRRYLTDNETDIITIDNINRNYYYEFDLDKLMTLCRNVSFIPIINNTGDLVHVCSIYT